MPIPATASLFARGTKRIALKVGEEGLETALAAATYDKEELVNEASDLIYHLLVLLEDQDLSSVTSQQTCWQDIKRHCRAKHKRLTVSDFKLIAYIRNAHTLSQKSAAFLSHTINVNSSFFPLVNHKLRCELGMSLTDHMTKQTKYCCNG